MIGQVLDRYRLEAKLGEGGMGVVYRAHDAQLDRVVAIKILPPDRVADPERKQRFVQEAKTASALNHPGIVIIHDIRSDAGIDFIVMELIAGKTLDQIIPANGLRPTQALRYGVEIADALARAHGAGIIHRNLKPSNVMVTDEGRIKVLDFGLAKLLNPPDNLAETRTQASPLTEEGTVVGTAAYMSPEQADGRKLDARSDIFSFGSLLYEMVTGRKAFPGDSRLSTLAKILNDDPPPPSQLAPAIPSEVERAILRCLRKDPARRYQTMADLKVALEDFAADSTLAAPAAVQSPSPTGASRWRWAWLTLVPIALVVGFVAWQTRRAPEDVAPLRAVPLTTLRGVTRSPSFSPDGNQVAFSWTGPDQDNQDVYVQQIGATGSPLRLTSDPGTDYSPIWSPDGRWIAFLRRHPNSVQHELVLTPPLPGTERKLADIRPNGSFLRTVTMSWCPDSSCLVVTDSPGEEEFDRLFVISLESREKRQLTEPTSGALADTDPAISPDGNWLVFRRDASPFTGELYALRLASGITAAGELRRLTDRALGAYNPRWMPDSSEIIFSAKGGLWRLDITGQGPPSRLPFVGDDGLLPMVSRPQPDRPSRLVYVRSFTDFNIWRMNIAAPGVASTGPPAVAVSSTRRETLAQFSPDGRRVTFTSDRSGELEIWAADAAGTNAIQLTAMGAIPGYPRWSPDGESIVFHNNPEGQGEVYVVPASGGKPVNLTHHMATDTFPTFSRDGKWIYFSSSRSVTEPRIWKIPAAGGTAIPVSPNAGLLAIESRDGAYVYYVDSGSTDSAGTLWRLPVAGGTPVKVVDGVASTSFDVIDGGVYYLERLARETRLQYFDFATRKSVTVGPNLGIVGAGLSVSADGTTILYSRLDSSSDDLMLVENFR